MTALGIALIVCCLALFCGSMIFLLFTRREPSSSQESFEESQMPHRRTVSIVEPQDEELNSWSDDECMQKLAYLIEHKNSRNLGEIAKLIGRLAVTVE